MLRSHEPAKRWMQRRTAKSGTTKAHAILEAKIGRLVFHLWRTQRAFDGKKFLASLRRAGSRQRPESDLENRMNDPRRWHTDRPGELAAELGQTTGDHADERNELGFEPDRSSVAKSRTPSSLDWPPRPDPLTRVRQLRTTAAARRPSRTRTGASTPTN
jgi:hypothetical protein